jgi:hypothetical protein
VGGGGADHQQGQADRGDRDQHGGHAGDGRYQQPEGAQDLKGADGPHPGVGEVLDPAHGGGQPLAGLAELDQPGGQEGQGEQDLLAP